MSVVKKADRYCAIALICLVLALMSLSLGVFLGTPTGVSGKLFLSFGILLMLGCIAFLALYNHAARKEPRHFS